MHRADRVDPSLIEQPPEQRPRLRLHQRVLGVGLRRIDVGVGRHDVEIPCEHDRRIESIELSRVLQQPLHPDELVFEFRSWLGVAVRCIEIRNQHAIDRCFDVAALRIVGITRQRSARDNGLAAAGEDGDAVPRLLPPPPSRRRNG